MRVRALWFQHWMRGDADAGRFGIHADDGAGASHANDGAGASHADARAILNRGASGAGASRASV